MRHLIDSPDALRALGRSLGERATPGTVVALVGDLGVGKTTFTQGIGEGLAVREVVLSPTFVLLQAYEGRLPLWHADLYRVERLDEIEQLGWDDALDDEGVVVVEWADRFPEAIPDERLEVRLAIVPGGRSLEASAHGAGAEALLIAWLGG